ncbi:dipeptidase [Sphingosinicella rhizophila]|uniref:Membrane dipeptidase n=1 Tax=Sphingosinicella rhizophila TaxID=3050082 RepID=A0ABU3Q5U2_9SPHN|nr:membrane dipeptidase [Sphingosinicella sp. GR2756]MDT9598766.1 membrane dipeptidase [Sphingosinicella sp. GR2756]
MTDSPLHMDRRRFAIGAFASAGLMGFLPSALAAADAPADNPGPIPQHIKDLYKRAISIDCLGSPNTFNVNYPPGSPHLSAEQLRNVHASGLTAINMTVGGGSAAPQQERIAGIKADVAANPDILALITRHSDIAAAKKAGKLGIILGFQGLEWAQDDLSQIDRFAEGNVLIMQLTYNQESKIGSGSLSRDPQPGLEAVGREAIRRINARKLTVDLAHSHPQTALDATRESTRPIIVSHTGCRAVYDHPRNQPDEVLKAVADGGGVTGIFIMPFLGLDTLGPTRALVTRHIVHALKVAGEDHVGIGTDTSITPVLFDANYRAELRRFSDERTRKGIAAPLEDSGLPFTTPGLNTPRRLEVIASDLAQAGVKDAVIEKVIGGNFHRVFRETWA